jgi:hypothetical protein
MRSGRIEASIGSVGGDIESEMKVLIIKEVNFFNFNDENLANYVFVNEGDITV